MKIKIEIVCDNAAFDEYFEYEIERILNKLSNEIVKGGFYNKELTDFNGNPVGKFEIEEDSVIENDD